MEKFMISGKIQASKFMFEYLKQNNRNLFGLWFRQFYVTNKKYFNVSVYPCINPRLRRASGSL